MLYCFLSSRRPSTHASFELQCMDCCVFASVPWWRAVAASSRQPPAAGARHSSSCRSGRCCSSCSGRCCRGLLLQQLLLEPAAGCRRQPTASSQQPCFVGHGARWGLVCRAGVVLPVLGLPLAAGRNGGGSGWRRISSRCGSGDRTTTTASCSNSTPGRRGWLRCPPTGTPRMGGGLTPWQGHVASPLGHAVLHAGGFH